MPWDAKLRAFDPRLLLIPVTIAASPGEPRLAPPEGQKFRHVIVEDRDDGAIHRRFTSERIIEFHATETGYVAQVTIIHNSGSAGRAGAMFVAAADGLRGRPIRLNLNRDGAVVSIEDESAIWEALCRSIDSAGGDARSQKPSALGYTSVLRNLPADRRRAMIASLIGPLIAGQVAPKGEHAILLPAQGMDGAPTTLSGSEIMRVGSDGTIINETNAAGTLAAPGGVAHISVAIRQQIDPRTGLVMKASEIRDSWIGEDRGTAHNIAATTSTLAPIVMP